MLPIVSVRNLTNSNQLIVNRVIIQQGNQHLFNQFPNNPQVKFKNKIAKKLKGRFAEDTNYSVMHEANLRRLIFISAGREARVEYSI